MGDRLIRDGVVLGAVTGVFGVVFGVLAATAGLSVGKAAAMSLLVFTGGSQFTAVVVSQSGGSPASAVGSALLLAARNGLYGVTLSPRISGGRLRKAGAAQLVIDESTAMAAGQEDDERAERAFWSTGLSVFVFWNVGTLVGATTGQALGDPAALGLDAAFPAGFVALLLPQLRDRPRWVAALAGATIALVCIPFVPAGVPILAASVGVLPAWWVARADAASRR